MKKYKSVSAYIADTSWKKELEQLRNILLKTELVETVKWSMPTYTINGKNVVGMASFKNYFGLWFFQGVFLKDTAKVLVNAQEQKTKALRQWRFYSAKEVQESLILVYVNEAIENQKQGKVLAKASATPLEVPELLRVACNQDAELYSNFKTLTPYKQKEYCEYIATAKRESTKQSRLEKIIPMIKNGSGLHDKYR